MKRNDGPFSAYEIIPGFLYQRGKLHKLPLEKKRAGLQYYGITHCVALAPPTPDENLGSLVKYTHEPVPDGLLRRPELLLGLAYDLAEEIASGGVVMTMCNAGRNRSGLLSALIICELSGIPGTAALEMVRNERPNALANEHFEKFLRSIP